MYHAPLNLTQDFCQRVLPCLPDASWTQMSFQMYSLNLNPYMMVLQAGALRTWMHRKGRIFTDENRDVMKWELTRPGIGWNGSNSYSNILKILEETSLVPLAFIPSLLTHEDTVVSSTSMQEVLGRRHLGFTIKYKSVFILRILNLHNCTKTNLCC